MIITAAVNLYDNIVMAAVHYTHPAVVNCCYRKVPTVSRQSSLYYIFSAVQRFGTRVVKKNTRN